MSVITSFFNTSTFAIENLTTNPKVIPDEAFEFNFYITDTTKQGTAKDVGIELFVKDGRNETLLTVTPDVRLVDSNTWEVSATIDSGEWDGVKAILMKATVKDILDVYHSIDSYLIEEQ